MSWREPGPSGHNNMRGLNWKALAGSAANRAKDYVAQKEYKNTYETVKAQLKGEAQGHPNWKCNSTSGGSHGTGIVERVHLFPGWAVRRYRSGDENNSEAPFDLEILASGYATASRPPELATRSQRVFMQLAKRFAALPKLPTEENEPIPRLSKSTEDLLKLHPLPVTPAEMADSEEKEMAVLEAQLKRAELDSEIETASMRNPSPPPSPLRKGSPLPGMAENAMQTMANYASIPVEELRKLHHNLNHRLEPFWSTTLSSRKIQISIFANPPQPKGTEQKQKEELLIDFGSDSDSAKADPDEPGSNEPLSIKEVLTTPTGDFQQKIRIPWETLCTHPKALYMAFGDRSPSTEYPVYVHAELISNSTVSFSNGTCQTEKPIPAIGELKSVTLSQTRLRIISDIDDTVKVSNILGGAKMVFHNVFVSELSRLVIHDMSTWYQRMWERGVRFHYVSNSPFELLPVINEFIQVSELPEGSVKLRSYSGRSLFNGLVSSPSVRKRTNVVDVLENFQESQFILVGDSGEQDLELYSTLARERPHQILAIFIRDVSTIEDEPLTDPTGSKWQTGVSDDILHLITNPNAFDSDVSRKPPVPVHYAQRVPSRRTSSMTTSSTPGGLVRHNTASSMSMTGEPTSFPVEEPQPMGRARMDAAAANANGYTTPQRQTEANLNAQLQSLPIRTRRRIELQLRVNKARDEIPLHVKLRIFKHPLECTETEELLYNLHL